MKHFTSTTAEARTAGNLETLLLLALFIFGIWGIIQVFSKNSTRDPRRLETMVSLPATLDSDHFYPFRGNDYLAIRQIGKGGLQIHFQIRSFEKGARYVIDFGDGEEIEMREQSTTYTYADAGQYRIRLRCINEGKAAELYDEILRIAPSGELAQRGL